MTERKYLTCDICFKDKIDKGFLVSTYELYFSKKFDSDGNKNTPWSKYDLCLDCNEKVADFIDKLRKQGKQDKKEREEYEKRQRQRQRKR